MQLLQYSLMPDHLHMLLHVKEYTQATLGENIARFKVEVNDIAGIQVFDKGFNDQILTRSRSLNTLYRYLRDNPRRLAVRRENPDWFQRVNRLTIGGVECQAYGNMQLLDNPFKEQVVVHRADSPDELRHKRERWLYTAANRGVLTSPFISPQEKSIRQEAEALGGKTILITHQPFPERYKPSPQDFQLCQQGRLLILSIASPEKSLSRPLCLRMNALAQSIATH